MKTGKLDKRFKGVDKFKYYAEFGPIGQIELFVEARNWCWQTFGSSVELDVVQLIPGDYKWSWLRNDWKTRLVFRDDVEYNWFMLKYHAEKNKKRLFI